MSEAEIYAFPNRPTPNRPVMFDPEVCIGCNSCIEACRSDVFLPNPEKGEPPIVLYPDECWYCGCCISDCPVADKGAIKMVWPISQKMRWKRKTTGEYFRL